MERVVSYVLFKTSLDGWHLYQVCRAEGLEVRISPTPRAARSCCGVSLLMDCDDDKTVATLAQEHGIVLEGIVHLPNQINPGRDTFC